jgi:hypothetical protein
MVIPDISGPRAIRRRSEERRRLACRARRHRATGQKLTGDHSRRLTVDNGAHMAKPNYGFDKRQRELKKSKQQEEKRLKKLARGTGGTEGDTDAQGNLPSSTEPTS